MSTPDQGTVGHQLHQARRREPAAIGSTSASGRVYLNGKLQKEPFIGPSANCDICNLPKPITIPKGHYFMMGDNRGESEDSRAWGPVPKKWIIGKAFVTYWPLSRIGIL